MKRMDRFFDWLEKWFPVIYFAVTGLLVLVTIPLAVFLWVYMFRTLRGG